MKHRKLRIAVTIASLIVCGFLILLWVASYNHYAMSEPSAIYGNTVLTVEFLHGRIAMVFSGPLPPGTIPGWLRDYPLQNGGMLPGVAGFAWKQSPKFGDVLTFPFSFLVVLVMLTGITPWLHLSFSVRTLLIATTLVAVGLGLIIWLASQR